MESIDSKSSGHVEPLLSEILNVEKAEIKSIIIYTINVVTFKGTSCFFYHRIMIIKSNLKQYIFSKSSEGFAPPSINQIFNEWKKAFFISSYH